MRGDYRTETMRAATPSLFALLLFLLPLLGGCGDGIDHYERAVAIERELLRTDAEAGYDHHRYVTILRELNRVPIRDGKRDQADAMARRIMDARRLHLTATMPQVDHLPKRLQGREVPSPQRPEAPQAAPTRTGSPVPAAPSGARATATSTVDAADAQVTLYSTSWCGYCRKARSWFQANGVPFVEKDIEKDPDAQAEYRSKANGYGGVPLIDVNGTVVRGFDQRRIEGLLAGR